MVKHFFLNTTLLIILFAILAIPFMPAKLIKYYSQKNVLSANSKEGVKIENAGELSRIVEVKAFPQQFAYYDKVFELRNFSNKNTFYEIESFVKNGSAKITANFGNGTNEILLHPNEKTYIDITALGTTENMEQVRVFLEISAKNIQ
ncbi:hypothetical protein KJ678_03290 [Patescibacteria group bacterium]|nr:hypothetical protein [Patescibacteria group bacterium]